MTDIKYIYRDFNGQKTALQNFAKTYYPKSYTDFSDNNPGAMFLDMTAYVGDILSYYTDIQLRESLASVSQERANLLRHAETFSYKPKISVPSYVTLDIFQLLPSIKSGSLYVPDWNYALSINSNAIVSSISNQQFRTIDSVDFRHSSSISPTDVSIYQTDAANNPIYYVIKKQILCVAGNIKTATYTFGDPKRYDQILIADTDIIEIIDIVDSDNNIWYEVPYLSQDLVLTPEVNSTINSSEYAGYFDSVPYLLKVKKTSRRFTTKVLDNDNLIIQFGAGTSTTSDNDIIPVLDLIGSSLYSTNLDYNIDPLNFLYTKTYGLAPNNTTLNVRYTTGGGITSNVNANTLTKISNVNINTVSTGLDQILFNTIRTSIAVNNTEPATGGKDLDDMDELRINTISAFASQNRAVTANDFISRVYSMPQKFGSIAKAYVQKNQNESCLLDLYVLSYDSLSNLTKANSAIKFNLKNYVDQYRMLTDTIQIKDAYIVNIGIKFNIMTLPGVNSNEVLLKCIDKLKNIFAIKRWEIGQPIIISSIYSELYKVYGVQVVNDVVIYNLHDSTLGYSDSIYDLTAANRNGVIYASYDPCVFEIKFPNIDISGKVMNN